MELKRNILYLFLFNLLFTLIKADEDLIKNSKVLSCVSLARGAIKNEKVYTITLKIIILIIKLN